jgi:predicted nucleic acid-binding protein
MAAVEPYSGLTVIVDSCVLIKLRRAPTAAQDDFRRAHHLNRLRMSPIVELEMLYGMGSCGKVEKQVEFFEQFHKAPLSRRIGERAVQGMVELARLYPKSHGYHLTKWPDLLIAATAEERGYGVLHHDAEFEKISQVIDCKPIWFADRDEAKWSSK